MTWSLFSLTINCIFKLIDSVRAGKHYYPTNYGKLVSPTNGDVFALVRSSTNHQTCNRNMPARDTKIAIGVVFRVYVQIQHGKSEDTVKVVVDQIVNENFYIKQLGFFGIQKLKMRVEDGSLWCSSNAQYVQIVFDTLLNTHLDRSDVRNVLKRDWKELKRPTASGVKSNVFRMDNAESRKNVCDLKWLLMWENTNQRRFFKYTCNRKNHPDLRKGFAAFEKIYPRETTSTNMNLL